MFGLRSFRCGSTGPTTICSRIYDLFELRVTSHYKANKGLSRQEDIDIFAIYETYQTMKPALTINLLSE